MYTNRIPSRTSFSKRTITAAACAITGLMAILAPSNVHAQLTPISQNRMITGSTNCLDGCTPNTQTLTAPNYAQWTASVAPASSNPQFPGTSYGYSNVTQDSVIDATGVNGYVSVNVGSRRGSASGNSLCSTTFRIDQACSYSYSGTHHGGAAQIATTLRLTGPFGTVFSIVQAFGSSSSLGLLPAGEYTFFAQLQASVSGGSSMASGGDSHFNLALTPLSSPTVVTGPICNSANGHSYYQLSNSGWLEAEAAALQLGGHLVTINDAAENAWVLSTFGGLGPQHKWIGFSALAAPGTTNFLWITGDSLSYVNWATNPVAGAGDFALMLAGKTPTPGQWAQSPNAYAQDIVGGVVEVEVIPCLCNWNGNAVLDSADFFAFLADFFAGNADLNCSGDTTSHDFFQFITCFINGCG